MERVGEISELAGNRAVAYAKEGGACIRSARRRNKMK